MPQDSTTPVHDESASAAHERSADCARPSPSTAGPTALRLALAGLTTFTCVGAVYGAAALIAGRMDLGEQIGDRLPFSTWTVPGIALASLIAAPMALAAAAAWRRHPLTWRLGSFAGAVLIGWILFQLVVLRSTHPLTLIFGAVGVAILTAALVLRSQNRRLLAG